MRFVCRQQNPFHPQKTSCDNAPWIFLYSHSVFFLAALVETEIDSNEAKVKIGKFVYEV